MTILEHEIMMTEQLRRVPADELQARLNKFRAVMDREFPGWEIAIVNHKVQYVLFCRYNAGRCTGNQAAGRDFMGQAQL